MKINSLLLPHPVLGRGDDVSGEYRVADDEFFIDQDDLTTKLSMRLILKNKTLEDLISSRSASFNIEVECPSTFYRKSFLFSKNGCVIEIEKNNLRGRVVVSFYITCNLKISEYQIDGANEDYNNATFEVDEGDVLAFAGSEVFDASILWEDLRRIFNIMKIRKDTEREDGPALIDLNTNVIFISLSKSDYLSYENYKDENDSFTPLYHSSLVFSTLIYVLSEMMSDRKDDYKGLKWYRVLDSQKNGRTEISSIWDSSNIPLIAQLMLGEPVKRMLSSIETLSTTGSGEE